VSMDDSCLAGKDAEASRSLPLGRSEETPLREMLASDLSTGADEVALEAAQVSRWLKECPHSSPLSSRMTELDLTVPLLGAWWGLDRLSVAGHRNLWGSVAVLAADLLTSALPPASPCEMRNIASELLGSWAWRQLLADATDVWDSQCSTEASAPGALSAQADPEHNVLAWARRLHVSSRPSVRCCVGDFEPAQGHSLPGAEACLSAKPFDVQSWLPPSLEGGFDVHFKVLRNILGAEVHSNASRGSAFASSLLLISPRAVQRCVAAQLWQAVRRQLLAMEQPLRMGAAEPAALVQVVHTLLAVAFLAAAVQVRDSLAALRTLAQLCASHGEVLRRSLADGLPVFLWLADAVGALGLRAGAAAQEEAFAGEGAAVEPIRNEVVELVRSIFPVFTTCSGPSSACTAAAAAAAILRMPPDRPSALAQPLAEFLQNVAAAPGEGAVSGVPALLALRPRLRRWLQLHSAAVADGTAGTSSRVASHLELFLLSLDSA